MTDENEPRLRPKLGGPVVFAAFAAVVVADVLWYMAGLRGWGILVGTGVAGLGLLWSYWYDGGFGGPARRVKTTQTWAVSSRRGESAVLCGIRFGAGDAARLGVQPGKTYFYRPGEDWREVRNLLARHNDELRPVTVQQPETSLS